MRRAALAVLLAATSPLTAGDAETELQALAKRAAIKDQGARDGLLTFTRKHPGTSLHRRAAEALALLPSPADRLDANKITEEYRKFLSVPGLVAYVHKHTRAIASAAFSPDGRLLATAGWDGALILWRIDDAEPKVWATLEGSPSGASFSPDGKLLAAGGRDSGVLVWDVTGEKPVQKLTLSGHRQRPFAVQFSPTGKLFASGSHQPVLRLWKFEEAEPELWAALANEEDAPGLGVSSLSFSGDGKLLAAGSLIGKHTLRLWDVSGSLLDEKFLGTRARLALFSPTEPILALAADDPAVRLWRLSGDQPTELHVLKGHAARPLPPAVKALAFSPTGHQLATGGADRKLVVWDVTSGKSLREWHLHDEVRALAFASDGRHLAVGNDDGSLYVLRLVR